MALHDNPTVTLHLNIYGMELSIYISNTPKIVSRSLRRTSEKKVTIISVLLVFKN